MRDVVFEDLVYSVDEKRNLPNHPKKRQILKGVSGTFGNGKLSAIMGASGAGKSSLLNAISGYVTAGVTGNIQINRKTSCYITQEDCHQTHLSIYEMMRVACKLKLKSGSEFETVIEDILKGLNLSHRRDVYANKLSGGERKRLSIALELVANPSIFFLDEPTSGLDEVTAAHTIKLLRDLAHQDKSVVCTIHQPSARIFELFDHIYIVCRGQCVYQGSPKTLLSFLSHYNFDCPKYNNPADYVMEICDADPEKLTPIFSGIFDNGKSQCVSVVPCEYNQMQDFILKPSMQTMTLEKTRPQESTLIQKMKQFTQFLRSDSASSSLKQFIVLLNLLTLKIYRNKIVLWIQLIHHLLCGVSIGVIFWAVADDGNRMFDHLKFCIAIVFFCTYTQMIVPILSFPQELKVVKKECFNRWYSLTPYYLALTVARLPLQVLFNLIFTALVYFMSGLPHEWWRFVLFASVAVLVSAVAEGLGLAIGSTFSVTNGCAVGPALMAPFLGLAIYGFDFAADIPNMMYGLMKLSFIRGGVISLVLTVFGFQREQLQCSEVYCHFDDPKVLLRYLRIENVSLLREVTFMIGLFFFFRILFYLSLRKKLYR